MLMSSIVLVLYFLGNFTGPDSIGGLFLVDTNTAIANGVALGLGIALYLWTPSRFATIGSAIIYFALVAAIGMLVVKSGGISSPFIALWMGVSVFSGIFGLYGIVVMLLLVNAYIAYSFFGQTLEQEQIIFSALAGELPIVISYIIWSGHDQAEEERDSSMSNLNKALTQESSKSDAVIKAIGDGVIVVDARGNLLLVNPAAQQMIGWSGNDAVNLHYESVLKLQNSQGENVPELENPINRVLNTNQQVRENDIVILTKSGRHVSAAFVVTPVGDSGEGAIAVFRDVTKERAEEREQAEFISTASHEMRTPVASIEGYLGLALNPNTAQVDEKARDYINKAHESAQHLGHLFQDLLDITKIDDGRFRSNPRVIDVVEFTRGVTEDLSMKAKDKGLTVTYKPDGSKSTIGTTVIAPILYTYVDRDHLREVLSNIIDNAIKYTPQGDVSIDVTGDDERIKVAIKDSGIGIADEDLPHLFQKFYRIDNSDTREIGGTGLGLYLCRRIVETMEGRIWVESEFQKGSTFYVEIPRLSRDRANDLIDQERSKQAAEQQQVSREKAASGTAMNTNMDVPTLDQVVSAKPEASPSAAQVPATTIPPVVTQPQTPPQPQVVASAAVQPISTPVQASVVTTPVQQPQQKSFGAVNYTQSPVATTPQNQPSTAPSTIPRPQQASQRQNISLSDLERNPSSYITRPKQ
jgi:PAS domain S-box-containing protein